MKRREFLKKCGTGIAAGTGVLVIPGAALSSDTEPKVQKAQKKIVPARISDSANSHFLPGRRGCAEALLMAGCEVLGIKSDVIPEIAAGLAGGIGCQGEICGVILGASMVASLAVSGIPDYMKRKQEAIKASARLYKKFKQKFGKTDCISLSGVDLRTPEGRKAMKESVKAEKCSVYVRAMAEILAAELEFIRELKKKV
jgi:C_GCAxxG_C_C family probable redox protein